MSSLATIRFGTGWQRPTRSRALTRLARTPDLYLLAMEQFATSADTELMRSFSLVLLRRLLFRSSTSQRVALYDHLGAPAFETLQRILLLHEPATIARRKTVDTVTDLSNQATKRGHPWPALQPIRHGRRCRRPHARGRLPHLRRLRLIIDLNTDGVVSILQTSRTHRAPR
ncbi:hypothetical protein C8Q76DRAFT_693715 [Earliella scabrosa]|nr:hypothetical protein C8Q76DRAFT_693715 [Earliella scabrosa]